MDAMTVLKDLEKNMRDRMQTAVGDFFSRCEEAGIPAKHATVTVLTTVVCAATNGLVNIGLTDEQIMDIFRMTLKHADRTHTPSSKSPTSG